MADRSGSVDSIVPAIKSSRQEGNCPFYQVLLSFKTGKIVPQREWWEQLSQVNRPNEPLNERLY